MNPNLELCEARRHPVVCVLGTPMFCLVCHYRTDQAFAAYSRLLLRRIQEDYNAEIRKAA